MIGKAIQKNQKPFILILSIAGAVIGLSLLMLVVQLYVDMREIQTGSSGAINEQYLVVNKHVSAQNTLGFGSTELSDTEIENITSQPFVKDWAPFRSGQNFKIFAVLSMKDSDNGMSTLGFLESVPDKFIDVDTKSWNWELGDSVIPVIFPSSFLDAYNFGLANTVDAPVISKDLISLITIKVNITGNGKKDVYYARVVDFSDRINSTLVPESFLSFANATYGFGETTNPSKLVIATSNSKDPAIGTFLENNGLETNKEQLRGTIVQKLIYPILWFAGALCVVILSMTILIFLLYGEILVAKSVYQIRLLSLLGYRWKKIGQTFTTFFYKLYAGIAVLAVGVFSICKMTTNAIIKSNLLIDDLPFISIETIGIGVLFMAVFIAFNIVSTGVIIRRLASPK